MYLTSGIAKYNEIHYSELCLINLIAVCLFLKAALRKVLFSSKYLRPFLDYLKSCMEDSKGNIVIILFLCLKLFPYDVDNTDLIAVTSYSPP